MDDEQARVRSYLLAQAAKYDLLDLWPRVVAQRTAFLQALDGVSDEQARWRPPTGKGESVWSMLEVAQHLLTWSENVVEIVEATARGGTAATLPVGYLAADPATTLTQVRRALAETSVRLASLPQRLPAVPDKTATAEHPDFGALDHRAWFLFLRLHDADHLRQVEALKQADAFPA